MNLKKKTALLLSFLLVSNFAQAADQGSDKLDLKKLEDKYWSAKDTDFGVVQNRTYTKAGRIFTSLSYGPMVNDAYLIGRLTNIALGYYGSERWGFEFAYEKPNSLKENDSINYFSSFSGVAANYNKPVSYTGLNVIWVPFYAKMSFLDRSILYFDMQFAAGVGSLAYEQVMQAGNQKQSTTAYNFDFTQQLFFSENFAVRLDVKNRWSSQNRRANASSGSQCGASGDCGNFNQQDTSYLLGITVFFGKSGNE